jgi:hypothetical protein
MTEQNNSTAPSADQREARAFAAELRKLASAQAPAEAVRHAHAARALLGLHTLRSKLASAITPRGSR